MITFQELTLLILVISLLTLVSFGMTVLALSLLVPRRSNSNRRH